MVDHVRSDPVEDLVELIARDGRLQLAVGQLQRQVPAAPVPDTLADLKRSLRSSLCYFQTMRQNVKSLLVKRRPRSAK